MGDDLSQGGGWRDRYQHIPHIMIDTNTSKPARARIRTHTHAQSTSLANPHLPAHAFARHVYRTRYSCSHFNGTDAVLLARES